MNSSEQIQKIKDSIGNLASDIRMCDSQIYTLYCKPENFEFLDKRKTLLETANNIKIKIVVECFPTRVAVPE